MRKLIALLSTLLLAGCASLPTEVAIERGPELAPPGQQDFSYYSPSSPVPGASAQEIVSGFLAAGTGPQNDYEIAREYLTEGFAPRWKPDTQTLIRVGAPVFESPSDALQIVQLNVGARIDDQGRYENLDSQQTNLRFQLVLEEGEWRIASAPNLTVVTLPVFSVVFNALPVFFLDNTSSHLIPDLRWFPTRTSTPTRLVNALLAGPADWLQPAVVSAIPTGTALTVNAVRVESGVAQVDFDANALEADSRQRSLMLSQLVATLQQLSGVANVALSVNGARQEIEQAPVLSGVSQSTTFALTDDSVVRLSGSEAGPLPNSAEVVSRLRPEMLAVDAGGQNLVLMSEAETLWLATSSLGTSRIELEVENPALSMQFDRGSKLFVYPREADRSIRVFNSDSTFDDLDIAVSGSLVDAQLSPEGSRLALIVQDGDEAAIHIFGVIRDLNGRPITLTEGLVFKTILGSPLSLSWNDLTNLRVLERTASGLTALSEYPITGPRQQLNMPPATGKKLEAGSVFISSYLLSDSGEVWVLSNNTWRRIQTGVKDISTGRF